MEAFDWNDTVRELDRLRDQGIVEEQQVVREILRDLTTRRRLKTLKNCPNGAD